jgi:arylsulfatase A-like enzyme
VNRRDFLKGAVAGSACLGFGTQALAAGKRADKPNFIIILADDMGVGGTSVYGGWIKTPHLEQLAAEGVKFTDFHSNSPVCSPTRAALITGRYQQRAGIPGVIYANPSMAVHYTGLQTSEITFPKLLKKAGYTCAIMGKWHLGYQKQCNPVHHGFDEFHGYVSGNVDYISHYDGAGNHDWWDGLEQVEEAGYTTHLITKHSVKFIEENRDRPFCLYVPHEAVHSPFQGPDSQIVRGPNKGKRADGRELSKEEAYVRMTTEMDKGIGEIVAAVNRLGLADNTLIFFFSDNGHARAAPGPSSYKYPLRSTKGTVWEGGHRVPAIAWWPGRIKPGTVNNDLFIGMDLMPTMLELAGAGAPEGHKFDGVSMAGALLEGKKMGPRQLFWDGLAMRDGKWKFVAGRDGGLFDLDADLHEQNNLADKYPERVSKMAAAIGRWKMDVATGATKQPDSPAAVTIKPGREVTRDVKRRPSS